MRNWSFRRTDVTTLHIKENEEIAIFALMLHKM